MEIRIDSLRIHWNLLGFKLHVPELHLRSAESVAIIGPSGSGKTTFLKLLAGIIQANGGTIQLGKTVLSQKTDNERRVFRQHSIGYVFQDFKLIEYLDVRENILTPWRLSEKNTFDKATMRKRAMELIERLGLSSLSQRPILELSHGERQRTAIARALLLKPGLVLADEPTGNLDPANKTVVRDLLLSEAAVHRSTLIMVTHDRSLVDGFDRVIDFAEFQIPPAKEATPS